MSLPAMLDDLPTDCDVGTKKNSKGYRDTWVGYKLHLDVADGQIPISCLLTSASLHDSQAAIPLATTSGTSPRPGLDPSTPRRPWRSTRHVPLIDRIPPTDNYAGERSFRTESLRRLERIARRDSTPPEQVRYNERARR